MTVNITFPQTTYARGNKVLNGYLLSWLYGALGSHHRHSIQCVLMIRVLVARVAQQSLGGVYGAPDYHGRCLGLVVQPRPTVHLKVNEINITMTVNDSAWRPIR